MPAPRLRDCMTNKLVAEGIGEWLLDAVANCRESFPSCLSCASFDETYSWCHRYNGNPPPRVIVYGCESYSDNHTPPFP